MDTPHSRPAPSPGARRRKAGELSIVQAAVRRRLAERAFEDYVREMARRWEVEPPKDGTDPSGPLPHV